MEALGSIPTGIGSERAQLFRVLAEVGEYAMTLLWTSASLAVELRGDRRFQPGEACEDGPPAGFHSGHRQVQRDCQVRIRPQQLLIRSAQP